MCMVDGVQRILWRGVVCMGIMYIIVYMGDKGVQCGLVEDCVYRKDGYDCQYIVQYLLEGSRRMWRENDRYIYINTLGVIYKVVC